MPSAIGWGYFPATVTPVRVQADADGVVQTHDPLPDTPEEEEVTDAINHPVGV